MQKKSPIQLYDKLFHRYMMIILCIVLALILYFITTTRNRIVETNLNYMTMMEEEAAGYLKQSEQTAGYIHADLYRSPQLLNDMIQYLRLDEEAYLTYRLDTYMESAALEYAGFEDFVENSMKKFSDITYIELISYDRAIRTECYPGGQSYVMKNTQEKKDAIESNDLGSWGEFSYLKEIRDTTSMQSVGCMIIHFDGMEFDRIRQYYSMADLIVCNTLGTITYASAGEEKAEEQLQEVLREQEKENRAYIQEKTQSGYHVYSSLGKQAAARMNPSVIVTIVAIGFLLTMAGMFLVHTYLKHLTQRLNYILGGMQSVMKGDLSVRLQTEQRQDELDVISNNFNEMCRQLDLYIQKSYLAEIEQKNAEMEALQSQINPHFLYNTLESIRMKAICNGDREVGRMLYSLAVIFRSQIKEADIIMVAQELHYCKKYLELFEYRFQGKFTFHMECPEELMNYPIIKFILQPVIENYFVHGIRAEEEGNEITIRVEKTEDALLFHVTDNGRGMDEEAMQQKNRQLQGDRLADSRSTGKKSIGLTNVNRRLKAVYGESYGVVLARHATGGMDIVLRVGLGEKITNEKNNAD